MKKMALVLLLALLLGIAACSREHKTEMATKLATSQQGSYTIASTQTSATTKSAEITFLPEKIKLNDSKNLYSSKEPMRDIYFGVFSAIHYVLPDNSWESEWDDDYIRKSTPIPEMLLVYLIRRYNVPKNEFEEALRKEAEKEIGYGYDLSEEEYELPNADILYTFDNEIIDAYYRRENPVVPDWETLKVYDSYSAYLEENQ